MKRAIVIQQDLSQINTVEDLTGVFESIASIKIARIRNRVITSKEFFAELWQTYRGIRIDSKSQLAQRHGHKNGKSVLVAVTTEGRLSGDTGNKVIEEVVAAYNAGENIDVIVLGAHGEAQLRSSGVPVSQMYHLPEKDEDFDTTDVIAAIEPYEKASVFYQVYESLRVQRTARIELVSAVRALGDEVSDEENEEPVEVITSEEFIFEPGIDEIADYLESSMMGVALTQVLMESKLAQHAGRFNAMNAAKHRAKEMKTEFDRLYHRAKRAESDERLKEIVNVVKGQAV